MLGTGLASSAKMKTAVCVCLFLLICSDIVLLVCLMYITQSGEDQFLVSSFTFELLKLLLTTETIKGKKILFLFKYLYFLCRWFNK